MLGQKVNPGAMREGVKASYKILESGVRPYGLSNLTVCGQMPKGVLGVHLVIVVVGTHKAVIGITHEGKHKLGADAACKYLGCGVVHKSGDFGLLPNYVAARLGDVDKNHAPIVLALVYRLCYNVVMKLTLRELRQQLAALDGYIDSIKAEIQTEQPDKSEFDARDEAETLVFGALLADLLLIQFTGEEE